MKQTEPHIGAENRAVTLRRILVIAAMVLAVLLLIGVAVYAGAFLMLAPMMQ